MGNLFANTERSERRTELVVLITPSVIRTGRGCAVGGGGPAIQDVDDQQPHRATGLQAVTALGMRADRRAIGLIGASSAGLAAALAGPTVAGVALVAVGLWIVRSDVSHYIVPDEAVAALAAIGATLRLSSDGVLGEPIVPVRPTRFRRRALGRHAVGGTVRLATAAAAMTCWGSATSSSGAGGGLARRGDGFHVGALGCKRRRSARSGGSRGVHARTPQCQHAVAVRGVPCPRLGRCLGAGRPCGRQRFEPRRGRNPCSQTGCSSPAGANPELVPSPSNRTASSTPVVPARVRVRVWSAISTACWTRRGT